MTATYDFLVGAIGDLVDFDVDRITPQTGLMELQLSSLDYVALQTAIKKAFGIEIEFDDFTTGKITNVEEFCNYIDSRRQAA